jgi:hypothetical protein
MLLLLKAKEGRRQPIQPRVDYNTLLPCINLMCNPPARVGFMRCDKGLTRAEEGGKGVMGSSDGWIVEGRWVRRRAEDAGGGALAKTERREQRRRRTRMRADEGGAQKCTLTGVSVDFLRQKMHRCI